MGKSLNLKPKDAQALEEFTRGVRMEIGPVLVELKLFGSKATGRDVPDSDIDVLVVVNDMDVAVENQVLDIAFQVNLTHDVYISPRVIAREVFDHPVWKITPFIRALEKEGIPL